MLNKLSKTVFIFFISILFVACLGSKINMENYKKVKNGMSLNKVESILGSGDENATSSYGGYSASVYTWSDGFKVISITFSNGKVSAKAQVGL